MSAIDRVRGIVTEIEEKPMCGALFLNLIDFDELNKEKWDTLKQKLEDRKSALETKLREVNYKIEEMDRKHR